MNFEQFEARKQAKKKIRLTGAEAFFLSFFVTLYLIFLTYVLIEG